MICIKVCANPSAIYKKEDCYGCYEKMRRFEQCKESDAAVMNSWHTIDNLRKVTLMYNFN